VEWIRTHLHRPH